MSHQLRRLLAFPLLAIAGFIGLNMYWRYQRDELWGHAPLFLYLLVYAAVLLLLTLRRDGSVRPNNLLSVLSGVLLGLGFPGYLPFPFALLIAFVPLLVLHTRLRDTGAGYGRVFWHGFSAFLLYNVLATYWVTNTSLAAGLFAILVNSLLMTLPWLAFHWTSRKSPRVAYLALGAFWISFEHLHYNWSLNWPWLTLGNGFAQFPALIQWYELTGALGGTVWILGANYLAFRWYQSTERRGRPLLALGLVVLLPMAFSLLRYATYRPAGDAGTISVVAIQPNFEPHYEKFADDDSAQLDTFLNLSRAALAVGPVDYLLYPETSFARVEENRPLSNPSIRGLFEALSGQPARYLVTGFDGYYIFAAGEPVTEAVRYFDRADGSILALEALNATLQIDLATGEYQTYRKGVFVPGAESFPFKSVFFFLEDWVNSLGGTVAGRGTQSRRLPLVGEKAKVAPVICYESVFGDYFTDYIREGAQAIFVMTNDGWWDKTAGHRQHLWFSSLRAIETRRAVVRSANTGISSFTDQRGHISSQTRYDEATFLRGEMALNNSITLYVRFGDVVARIALLLAAMLLLGNLTRSISPDAFSRKKA